MAVLTIDSAGFRRLVDESRGFAPGEHRRAWRILRELTLATVRNVKVLMPVDTGRARASWGLWTADLAKPNGDASESDAILRLDESRLETVQGSNVPYIGALNDGHSKQAPRGFLDMAQEIAEQALDARLAAEGLL